MFFQPAQALLSMTAFSYHGMNEHIQYCKGYLPHWRQVVERTQVLYNINKSKLL